MADYIDREALLAHLYSKQDEPVDVALEIAQFPGADVGPDSRAMQDVLARLADYEDTGLTPDGVRAVMESIPAAAAKEYGAEPDLLRDLVKADKEGRVVAKGRPVITGGFYDACSVCGYLLPIQARYCPHCGAKMDGDT